MSGQEGTEEQSEGGLEYAIPRALLEVAERRYESALAGGDSNKAICMKMIDTVIQVLGLREVSVSVLVERDGVMVREMGTHWISEPRPDR